MKKLMVVVGLWSWSATVAGKVWICPDTSFAMVNSNVCLHAVDGDTVFIPAGTGTWTGNQLIITNIITLLGAGTNQTRIINTTQNGIAITPKNGGVARITGMNLDGGGTSATMLLLQGSGSGSPILVDSIIFTNNNTGGLFCIWANDVVGGLITHCSFLGYNAGIQVNNPNWNNQGPYGDGSWATASTEGTTNCLVIEDCFFHGIGQVGAMDGVYGGRWTFRHNVVTNDILVAHGTDSTGRPRGTRQVEIYNNEFDAPSNFGHELRSGFSLIFSNNCINFSSAMVYKEYRDTNGVSNPCQVVNDYNPWGGINGSAGVSSGDNYDLKSGGVVQLAIDQVGRGSGNLLSGTTPAPTGWPSQVNQLCYVWRNTNSGVLINASACSSLIVNGRDFTNSTSGPVGYTPLVYPHPLLTGSPAPAPAASLRINGNFKFTGNILTK